ncbi:hypothetical protein BH09PSE6_BH09PSE6_21210 [soil metagenome]
MIEIVGIDHVYISVSSLARSRDFYDRLMMQVLGFRRSEFELAGEPHVQYFNRHFGYVLRPARGAVAHDPYLPGLHHLCLRVESIEHVVEVAEQLVAVGIEATSAARHGDYAEDYWATFFTDPDGLRLEITNYRQERRERHDHWSWGA